MRAPTPAPPLRPRQRRRSLMRVTTAVACIAIILGAAAAAATHLRGTPHPAITPPTPIVEAATTTTLDYRGGVLRTDHGAFAIGADGDVVVVGDWDCDGVATPALLRLATAHVYSLHEWAIPGRDVAGDDLGVVDGAT